jgi:hypothetical protein
MTMQLLGCPCKVALGRWSWLLYSLKAFVIFSSVGVQHHHRKMWELSSRHLFVFILIPVSQSAIRAQCSGALGSVSSLSAVVTPIKIVSHDNPVSA